MKKQIYELIRDLKKQTNINNVLDKHHLETNHDFNFKNSKMFIYILKNAGKLLNLRSFQTTMLSNRNGVFFSICLLIWSDCCWKIKNPLFKRICVYHLYIFR